MHKILYTRKLEEICTESYHVMNTHLAYKNNKSTEFWHEFDYETRPRTQFKITYDY